MSKKNDETLLPPDLAFNFPSVVIDGVEGTTIWAPSQVEAEKKLQIILNNSNDEKN